MEPSVHSMTVEQFHAFSTFFFHIKNLAAFLANIFNVTAFVISTHFLFCLNKAGKNRHVGVFSSVFFSVLRIRCSWSLHVMDPRLS
jgi:hypothetical protein